MEKKDKEAEVNVKFEFPNLKSEVRYDNCLNCEHLFFIPKNKVKNAPSESKALFYVFCKNENDKMTPLCIGSIELEEKHIFKAVHNAEEVIGLGARTLLIIGAVLYTLNEKYGKED